MCNTCSQQSNIYSFTDIQLRNSLVIPDKLSLFRTLLRLWKDNFQTANEKTAKAKRTTYFHLVLNALYDVLTGKARGFPSAKT